jgi:hypothetical protein
MEGRAMGEHSEIYVAFDTAKLKHAVAIAEAGRKGEIRFVGEIENRPSTIERMIKKLALESDAIIYASAALLVFASFLPMHRRTSGTCPRCVADQAKTKETA